MLEEYEENDGAPIEKDIKQYVFRFLFEQYTKLVPESIQKHCFVKQYFLRESEKIFGLDKPLFDSSQFEMNIKQYISRSKKKKETISTNNILAYMMPKIFLHKKSKIIFQTILRYSGVPRNKAVKYRGIPCEDVDYYLNEMKKYE
uniref:Uncharacterized protein n=1 Tax=Parastrongyloides trichosuri TaxID=131310 RepID=A0A0N4ZHG4_PARTI